MLDAAAPRRHTEVPGIDTDHEPENADGLREKPDLQPATSSPGTVSARPKLGRLSRVEPRSIWISEARDFTPWVLANFDHLAAALGIELELAAAEHPVGGFSLDLVGRDLTHDCVLIVENQLEASDHTHLGQLLTYAAGTGAATIVWIATTFREEHRQALDWLNEHTDEHVRVFGIQIEVVRIGDSLPAPVLRLVSEPNDWQKQVRTATTRATPGGRAAMYVAFWTKFLDRIHAELPGWTRARRPQQVNWVGLRVVGPIAQTVSFGAGGRLRSELYIDSGDGEANLEFFSKLAARRTEIEAVYGRALEWEELPERRACRVADYGQGDVTVEASFDGYIDWFFDTIKRWRAVLDDISAKASQLPQSHYMPGDGAAPGLETL